MKLTVCLSAFLIALLALSGRSRADSPDGPYNPYANLDPDGVPLAVTQHQNTLTPEQLAAQQKEAEQESRDRNWLLLDYQKVLSRQARQSSGNREHEPNVLLELSMNKDLARLAGLNTVDRDDNPQAPSPRVTPDSATRPSMGLRPETRPPAGVFTPLISPLSPSASSAAIQPFAISTFSTPMTSILAPRPFLSSPGQNAGPKPAPYQPQLSPTDSTDLQTPGMVAARNNPLSGSPNLNLDSLPDEPDVRTRTSQEAVASLPELPQAMDPDQLHQSQLVPPKLSTPVRVVQQPPPTQQPLTPAQAEAAKAAAAETEPVPVSQQPMLSPVHPAMGNPYDILNR